MKHAHIKHPDEEQDQSFWSNNNRNEQFIMSDSDHDDDDDDGSYIEIALDPKPSSCQADHLLQFRLSFSTMLPRQSNSDGSFSRKFLMPAESVRSAGSDKYTSSFDSSSMSSCSSSSSAVLGRSNGRRNACGMVFETCALGKSSENRPVEKENKWRKAVQLLAVQRLMKLLILMSLRSSPRPTRHYDCNTTRELADEKCWKVNKRKQSKVSKALSSGLMKLIIKFRTIKAESKIQLTKASKLIPRPEQVTYGREPQKLSYSCYESPVEPFLRRERKRSTPSRLPELSINSIKGVIDSLTVSCPASIKSSPIHNRNYCATEIKPYTRENSIQAAIAHCKMSLERHF